MKDDERILQSSLEAFTLIQSFLTICYMVCKEFPYVKMESSKLGFGEIGIGFIHFDGGLEIGSSFMIIIQCGELLFGFPGWYVCTYAW